MGYGAYLMGKKRRLRSSFWRAARLRLEPNIKTLETVGTFK